MERQIIHGVSLLLITVLLTAACFVHDGTAEAKSTVKKGKYGMGKVLIVYYSFSGNTRLVAKTIQDLTGGDLVELKPVENYSRPDLEAVAREQVREGYKPKLQNAPIDIEPYDYIFVGSPVWWFSYAPPVGTFLSQHDFKGKKVVPFWTYIDVDGNTFKDFEKACRGGRVLDGKGFTSAELKEVKKVRTKIEPWLRDLK